MTTPTWTEERIELMKKLVADGLSALQISREMGGVVSRSAVIGKANRLGVSLAHTPGTHWPIERERTLKRLHVEERLTPDQIAERMNLSIGMIAGKLQRLRERDEIPKAFKRGNTLGKNGRFNGGSREPRTRAPRLQPAIRPRKKSRPKIEEHPEVTPIHVKLMDLEVEMCRWPYGESDFTFCGHERCDEALSYCAYHERLSRVPQKSEGQV